MKNNPIQSSPAEPARLPARLFSALRRLRVAPQPAPNPLPTAPLPIVAPTPPAIIWITDTELKLREVHGLVDDFPTTTAPAVAALLADEQAQEHLTAALGGVTSRFLTDYQERKYLHYLQPRCDSSGAVIGCRGVTLDMSATRAGDENLCGQEVEAARIRMLGEFLDNASHDLRTPLSIMYTSLHLLKKTTDPTRQAERLEVLGRTVKRMERILEEMFVMARLDALPHYVTARLDLAQLLSDLADHYRQLAQGRDVAFSFMLPSALPGFTGHHHELTQAFDHVLRNAFQHTPTGGRIDLRAWQKANRIQVEICDTGSGIAPEDLPHIFERFFRSDKHRPINDDRVGLGLSIAQKVFERHGGAITAESSLGEGSRFLISLPYPNP